MAMRKPSLYRGAWCRSHISITNVHVKLNLDKLEVEKDKKLHLW